MSSSRLLHVEGVAETPEVAARFAEAKHPLEHALGKTILVQPSVRAQIPPTNHLPDERTKKQTAPPPVAVIR